MSEVSIKPFVKWKDESRETNRMTRYRQLKELVDRLLLGDKTVEDTKNILMTSLYRIGLTTAETNLMNATKLRTMRTSVTLL